MMRLPEFEDCRDLEQLNGGDYFPQKELVCYASNHTNGIVIKNLKTNEESVFIADEDDEIIGLFVFVGLKSQTDLFKGLLNLDEKGYIKTDENMKTNIDGVYAIGDCRSKDLRQVITACNDGAIAAINVEKYIN